MIDFNSAKVNSLMSERNSQKLKDLTGKLQSGNNADAEEVSKQFEAMFTKIMLKNMTKTLNNGSMLSKQPGSDYYEDIFLNQMASQIAEEGELGIANQIMSQLNDLGNSATQGSIRSLNITDRMQTMELIKDEETGISKSVKDLAAQIGGKLGKRLTELAPIIEKAANKYGLDKKLIMAVIAQESYGYKKAVSPVGAKGLMQLMDATARDLGVKDSFDPEQNIMGGSKYLKIMLNKFSDTKLALAAYNAGPGNVAKYNGVPPFKETRNYINKIMNYFNNFNQKGD